ncbi:hypothetical protein L195_g046286, partial [Trifolium pratense]
GHNVATSNYNASTSPPSAPVAKATAKVLVTVKAKEIENDGANEKSNSSSPGDVLVKTNSSLSRNSNGDAIDQLHDAKMTEESDHSDSKIVYK